MDLNLNGGDELFAVRGAQCVDGLDFLFVPAVVLGGKQCIYCIAPHDVRVCFRLVVVCWEDGWVWAVDGHDFSYGRCDVPDVVWLVE